MAAPMKHVSKYLFHKMLCVLQKPTVLSSHTNNRCYARNFLNRKAVHVISHDEAINLDKNANSKPKSVGKDAKTSKIFGVKSKFKLPESIHYERLEEGDRKFGSAVMIAKSRKLREKENTILLEGKRLIIDAIESGISMRNVYFDRIDVLEGIPFSEFEAKYFKVSTSVMKTWSDLSTPPGVMALCEKPGHDIIAQNQKDVMPITLILDNIRDPGNMGTLLRSAAAVGCQKVICVKGNVDVWDPKVLRAGSGAQFRCHLVSHIGWERVAGHLPQQTYVCLADSDIHNTNRTNRKTAKNIMEAVSSIEPDIHTELDESLGETVEIDSTYLNNKILGLFKHVKLDISSLYDVDFSDYSHLTLVVGGETEGLGVSSTKLAFDKGGERVHIPVAEGVESLNAGVAGSVVLFEMKRQLMKVAAQGGVESDGSSSTEVENQL